MDGKQSHNSRSFDCLGINGTKPNAADLAFFLQLGQDPNCLLDFLRRVESRALEDIDSLAPLKRLRAIINAAPQILLRPIRGEYCVGAEAAFDIDDEFIRVFWARLQVVAQEMAGVVTAVGGAVDFSAVDTGRAVLYGGVQHRNELFWFRWFFAPGKAWAYGKGNDVLEEEEPKGVVGLGWTHP